jgi:arsenate reductase
MAEGWARHYGSATANYVSGGTFPSREVHPLAIKAMAERGIDIGGHLPKLFTSIPRPIAVTIAVCGEAAKECPTPPDGSEVEGWNLPDPAAAEGSEEERLNIFRASRDDIERRVLDLLERRGLSR